MRARWVASPLLAALAVGCALKKPPETAQVTAQAVPNAKVSDAWRSASAAPGPVDEAWLAQFNDPQLIALVDEALKYNSDLARRRRSVWWVGPSILRPTSSDTRASETTRRA
jgi:hypothetical protein